MRSGSVASILLSQRRMLTRSAVSVAIVLLPHVAAGQIVEPDLGRAAVRHQKVWVTDATGIETAGRLVRADADSITIQTADGERSFILLQNVQGVYRRGDSVRSGAMAGAVSGAVFGLVAALNVSCGPLLGPHQRCNAIESTIIMGYMAGFGAAIGTGIDALHRGRTRIYPSLSRHSAGALISTSW